MNFLSLNIRGAGGVEKPGWVRRLKKDVNAAFIAIQETQLSGSSDQFWSKFWGGSEVGCASVEAAGRSGGLCSLWDPGIFKMDAVSKGQSFILVSGFMNGVVERLNILNVYAPVNQDRRKELWPLLSDLVNSNSGLWVALGDFNEVRSEDERLNSQFDSSNAMVFNSFIREVGFLEYCMMGRRFTYMNDKGDKLSKLDRAFVCIGFMSRWPEASLVALDRGLSDHCPLSLVCSGKDFGPCPFRFYNSWLSKEGLEQIFASELSKEVGCQGALALAIKLKALKGAIKSWRDKDKIKEEANLSAASKKVEILEQIAESRPLTVEERKERAVSRMEIKRFERAKAFDLLQKARIRWVTEGDENSKFFHGIINVKRARNRINGLDFDGVWVTNPPEIKVKVKNFFKSKFSEPIRRRPSFLNSGLKAISANQASALVAPFSEDEVWLAVKGCSGRKAPGPDGFNFKVVKKFWKYFKPSVMEMMVKFHSDGLLNRGCNSSFISLIPKSNDPQRLADFRPISLIGVIYKIVAKCLSNRLKVVMNDLVSDSQSAFVGGRSVVDGPLILSETISWAKKSKKQMFVLKVDFEKAYDSINWKFLLSVLEFMGFPNSWRNWIMGCLKSGRGSVIINGTPTGEFPLKRGLRQGDPLSPFLFVLAMEALRMFVSKAIDEGLIKGMRLPNNGPDLSFLCFADDVVFLGEWSEENILNVNRLLRVFFLVSGLKVNYMKSNIFGVGVDTLEIARVAAHLKCQVGELPFKYLGVPIGANMKRIRIWKPVIDVFSKKLSAWKAKTLSFAGRVTLAKTVLGSLPSYFLSLFKAPKKVINILEGLRRAFIWGKSGSGHKIRWLPWEKIIKPKRIGGLGVGGLRDFNLSMLAKWNWRVKAEPDLPWAKVILAIHGSKRGEGLVPCKKSYTGVWKDICSVVKEFSDLGLNISARMMVEVGKGDSIKFWKDPWLNGSPLKQLFPDLYNLSSCKDGMVSAFVSLTGQTLQWSWKWNRDPSTASEWTSIGSLMSLLAEVNINNSKDRWFWPNNFGVDFSVKKVRMEIWDATCASLEEPAFERNNWVPMKANILAWRACLGRLATKDGLMRRGLRVSNPFCCRCNLAPENADHLFVSCLFAKCVWWNVSTWLKVPQMPNVSSVSDLLNFYKTQPGSRRWKKAVMVVVMAGLWWIWLCRNDAEFDGNFIPIWVMMERIKEDSFLWVKYRSKANLLSWEMWSSFSIDPLL